MHPELFKGDSNGGNIKINKIKYIIYTSKKISKYRCRRLKQIK